MTGPTEDRHAAVHRSAIDTIKEEFLLKLEKDIIRQPDNPTAWTTNKVMKRPPMTPSMHSPSTCLLNTYYVWGCVKCGDMEMDRESSFIKETKLRK